MRSGKPAFLAAAACALLSMGCSSFFGHFTSHSITFHANGGVGADSVQTVQPNEDASLAPNTFSRTGYFFLGWSRNASASQPSYFDEATYSVGVSDVDLYAIWGTRQLGVWVKGPGDTEFSVPTSDGINLGIVRSSSLLTNVTVRLSNEGSSPLRILGIGLTQGAENPNEAFTLGGSTDAFVLASGKSVLFDIFLTCDETHDESGALVTAIFKIKSDDQDEAVDGFALNLSGQLGGS